MFTHFYNRRVRKAVAVFGSLFDDIYIVRQSGTQSVAQMKVPISYAPKQKFIERIQQMADGEDAERQLAIKLPRMSFEITAISYDNSRQLPKTNYYKRASDDNNKLLKFYTGVPYIINFQLNVYAKLQDDALQVVEQIIPYFNPQYTVTVKPIDGVDDITEDTPITLSSITFIDDYEGMLEQRRSIIYTLDFEMRVMFHGPKPGTGDALNIIKQVDANFHLIQDSDGGISRPLVEIVRVGTDPVNVSVDSDYGFTCKILQYWDDSA